MLKNKSGFTIVELLIVIVVIAILAAITIVAYNGIQLRAQASVIQSDLTSDKKKLLLYHVDNDRFPSSVADLSAANITASKSVYGTTNNNFYYCYNKATDQFSLGARTQASSTTAFIVTSSDSVYGVSGVGIASVCTVLGLTDNTDPNAWATGGYNYSTASWAAWVNG